MHTASSASARRTKNAPSHWCEGYEDKDYFLCDALSFVVMDPLPIAGTITRGSITGRSQDELLLKPRGWMQALGSSRPYRRGAVTSPDHRRLFNQQKEQWERETANVSSVTRIILNEAYQRIIGMGPTALPMIFSALKAEGGLWFSCLEIYNGFRSGDGARTRRHGSNASVMA